MADTQGGTTDPLAQQSMSQNPGGGVQNDAPPVPVSVPPVGAPQQPQIMQPEVIQVENVPQALPPIQQPQQVPVEVTTQPLESATQVVGLAQVRPEAIPIPVQNVPVTPQIQNAVAQQQIPGMPVPPPPPSGDRLEPGKKAKAKNTSLIGLSRNQVFYIIIGVLLLLVVVLSGMLLARITNPGVDVQIQVDSTKALDQNTNTNGEPTTTPDTTSEEASQVEEETQTITDVYIYLPLDTNAIGDISQDLLDEAFATSNEQYLMLPVKVDLIAGDVQTVVISAFQYLNADLSEFVDLLNTGLKNPIGTLGFNFLISVADHPEQKKVVTMDTDVAIEEIDSGLIDLVKLQIEATLDKYISNYTITLNGSEDLYYTLGTQPEVTE